MPEHCSWRPSTIQQVSCFAAVFAIVLGTLLSLSTADSGCDCHVLLGVIYERECSHRIAPIVTVESGQSVNLTCAAALQDTTQHSQLEARWSGQFENGTFIQDLHRIYLSTKVQLSGTECRSFAANQSPQYFTLVLTNITEDFNKAKIRCRIHFQSSNSSCEDAYFHDTFVLLMQTCDQPTPTNDYPNESTTNLTSTITTKTVPDSTSATTNDDDHSSPSDSTDDSVTTNAAATSYPTNMTIGETAAVLATVLRSDPMLLTLAFTAIICSIVSMVTTLAHCIMWMCCRKNATNNPNHHEQSACKIIANEQQYVAQGNCND